MTDKTENTAPVSNIPEGAYDVLTAAVTADFSVGDVADVIIANTVENGVTYNRDTVAALAREWAGMASDFKAARGSSEKRHIDKARVALIAAAKRAELEEDKTTPDYIALMRASIQNAHNKGEFHPEYLMAQCREVCEAIKANSLKVVETGPEGVTEAPATEDVAA